MTIIILIIILITAGLIIAAIKSKGRTKKIYLTLLLIVLPIPLCLILLIKPSQQGKIFPGWGKISLLFSEPDDLWIPLAKAPLNRNTHEYIFPISHKYVGHHNIDILFSDKNINVWKIDKSYISMSVSFYDSEAVLFSKTTSYAGTFKGLQGSGLTFIRYSLPEDLPINRKLNAKIKIMGNIDDFMNKYGDAKIIIKKGSDL
ncbi:MAG: hypothetical protein ACYSWS_11900 [Planctomycetota bacterium]|jgi:hypothetical protein